MLSTGSKLFCLKVIGSDEYTARLVRTDGYHFPYASVQRALLRLSERLVNCLAIVAPTSIREQEREAGQECGDGGGGHAAHAPAGLPAAAARPRDGGRRLRASFRALDPEGRGAVATATSPGTTISSRMPCSRWPAPCDSSLRSSRARSRSGNRGQ
mmetsp:Transcript_28641/g.47389  ORF Transcript_28641/g.47389 Transcript_28641/m.47389 type:complete len:156 (+) Transcript_28641:1349-1816(+)